MSIIYYNRVKCIVIKADTIDAAAGEILGILEGMSKHERNIYFHGWRGLGASTALRVVAQRLKSSAAQNMKFDKVVHVDCSLWQSMRALQKAVAEELELPKSVMAFFGQQDEEDDFNGIDQGSRGVILDVREEIFKKLASSTFVVIFHNGSRNYIDLYECGIPATTFLSNKVLWSWGSGFRLLYPSLIYPKRIKEGVNIKPDVFMEVEWQDHALHQEAADVSKYMGILEPTMIFECFQYVWAQRHVSHIDWGAHASNYWVCDGIIQGQDNKSAWEVGNALQRNIHLDWVMEDIGNARYIDGCISSPNDRWVSATHQNLLRDDIGVLPLQATSFFVLQDKSHGRRVILRAVMFPDNNRLCVLHLSWCTFSFASPPFICCSHLKFLLLDHCTDVGAEEHQSNNPNGSCFQKLWVLDLRYTDWYSKKIMCLFDELRELNVEGVKDWMSILDLCGGITGLVKLRVIADPDSTEMVMHRLVPNLSRATHLNTIILENCARLEQVVPDVLPPSLESFSFIINEDAIAKISSISIKGLAKLKSVLLRGFMGSLEELDISGTGVKTLDLREVVSQNLKRLILLGCEKLQAIQWPPSDKRTKIMGVLRINTIRSASSSQANWEEKAKETSAATRSSGIIAVAATKPAASFDSYISVRDARLLRSLQPIRGYFASRGGHMEIASSPTSIVAIAGGKCAQGITEPSHYLCARDINCPEGVATNEVAISGVWASSPASVFGKLMGWYVHIQDENGTKSGLVQQPGNTEGTSTGAALTIPGFICDNARTLYVHDSLSITSIPFPIVPRRRYISVVNLNSKDSWAQLGWCQVERCPKLSSVFATPIRSDDAIAYIEEVQCFRQLRTFWASQLMKACYIWKWSAVCLPDQYSFQYLTFLHLDYCPRLIHVLPLSEYMATLPHLETLEIVCCGDLLEIFPLDPERQKKQTIINFPELKRIRLHDLPRLQRICGSKMSVPKLETIKIRGCWSLRRLPAVAKQCPEVDCEKDWWDNLEWDTGDVNQNHYPSLYKPIHSQYYKMAQLPRHTILR